MWWEAKCDDQKVTFFANLDLHKSENFELDLVAIPKVGDQVESKTEWDKGGICTNLRLRVVNVVWKNKQVQIELNIPTKYDTMRQFYEWYERITNCKFI